MSIFSPIRFAIALAMVSVFSVTMHGQSLQGQQPEPGNLVGTVTDANGDPVPNATVILKAPESNDRRALVTPESGFFKFADVKPATPYEINVSAKDFADWTSPTVTVDPGQFKIVTGIELRIETERTSVEVHYDPVEVATEQFKSEERQRIFGIIPNFYVSYESDPAPLTAKMKFQLALKVSTDPVTVAGVVLYSGMQQAGDTPNYGQGAQGFGKRLGANAAGGFSNIMIGGAILPSLLHQDPRYFYQGTGTTQSRIRHALLNPFICKGDNGTWQPNYSSIGGNLASSAISDAYYPKSNRGVGMVFTNFAVDTGELMVSSLLQEFIFGKFTRRGGHMK
ncbi:MAG TPA: carboxypeptidase-like regulatory domain-containing protein [Candidatus Acidoferrum sp.]|nr:carboxypeptidase-like regulatory domain-containing protein [Candidatus Acidoferrum sp.]